MRIEPNVVVSTTKKNFPKMIWVIAALTRMSGKVIQVRPNDVADVVEHIRHRSLKCIPNIFKAKGKPFVLESTPGEDEGCLILISRCNVDLVVARKTIHERKEFSPSTFINDLINEGSGVVIFWTGAIEITVININVDGALLLCHGTMFDTQSVRGIG